MQLARIVSRPFDENTYVAWLDGREDCVVIDPGFEPDLILQLLDERKLTPASIINTHGHVDHIAGNAALKDRWPDCPLAVGTIDAAMLTNADLNLSGSHGLPIVSPPAEVLLEDGELYETSGLRFEIRHIPGHSPGHVVLIERSQSPIHVFGGDVLFAGSVGRSDFPGGDFELLASGIQQKLFTLPDDTLVFPGHGPATTIGEEKLTNPFVGLPAR